MMDRSLHKALVSGFNSLGGRYAAGEEAGTIQIIIQASECEEVGLGSSSSRKGKRIGEAAARQILSILGKIREIRSEGLKHIEELQLLVDGISKDRISDFTCTFVKSFLIDFTMERCLELGIPTEDVVVPNVYDLENEALQSEKVRVPVNPNTGAPILFVPKRWLRHVPWINYDNYFKTSCPQDDIAHDGEELDRVRVLAFNRNNFGAVDEYISIKERSFEDCANDPLFSQIPVVSARRHLNAITKLPTGLAGGADKKYEKALGALLPSLLYPHLEFAAEQVRTESGVSIRDLVFYNPAKHRLLKELFDDYGSRQIVVEMKNVAEVSREHIDQINRYLATGMGHFGIIATRHPLKKAVRKRTIDLWSGQRKVIIPITDQDIEQMVDVFESKNREPIDVIAKNFAEFRRECP